MTTSTTTIALTRRSKKPSTPRLLRSPAAMFSFVWLIGLVLASLSGPLWLAHSPLEQDLGAVLQGPSVLHPLGTDELGRDLLARIVTSAAPTLLNALIAAAVTLVVTVPLTLSAARNPRLGMLVGRLSEIVLSLPSMIILLAFIAAVGTNMALVMVLFGLMLFGALYRILIGQAQSLHKQLFVEAAAIDGVPPFIASVRHVLPNMANTLIVQFVLIFGVAIGMLAGLAFIGLGPQPPEPTWGGMIQAASRYIFQQPWMMIPPGAVLALTIIAANTLADVLSGGQAMPPPLVTVRKAKTRSTVAKLKKNSTPHESPAAVQAASPLLEVKDLILGVDEGPALVTGVSLSVQRGKVLGLVGESGCGKSVTSYALLGLLAPGLSVRSGHILWKGTELAGADEKQLQRVRGHEIAYISQEPTRALDPTFTIGWQLRVAIMRLRGVRRREATEIAERLLASVGIVDVSRVLKSYPHQISGGMAQRVAISLALAGRPSLIIADEPTTALDVTVQAEILALLRGLVIEREMSVIFVTHDLGVVADLCDDVAVMYAGEVIETGAVYDVLVRPAHPYTMALLAADPHAAVRRPGVTQLATIAGQVPLPAEWGNGCRFADRCRFASAPCSHVQTITPRTDGGGTVRCIRAQEVHGRQSEWLIAAGDVSEIEEVVSAS